MTMTLGDAFNQRKKIGAELEKWINRLAQSGADRKEFFVKKIEGKGAFEPKPGTLKDNKRHYTIEECQNRIKELIQEDQTFAMRISLTNQIARGMIVDLDGQTKERSVPELLVLRNEIIPKLERIARSTPVRTQGVNIIEECDEYIVYRSVTKREKKKQIITDKGHKVEEVEIEGYKVVDVTEYGANQRLVWNEVDRIQEFAESVKQAINQANKTELVSV